MNVVVIDGQGGGMGRGLVERIAKEYPELAIIAVGTNAMATAAMMKAGAKVGATGENAVCVCARDADVIMGPMGIAMPDALMGEVTTRMAQAVSQSRAVKILLPAKKCHVLIAGTGAVSVSDALDDAMRLLREALKGD